MSSTFRGNISVSIFGQSHSGGIGVVIDGLPAGEKIDLEALQAFLSRRAPGKNEWSTARSEQICRKSSPAWWTAKPAERR